MNEQNKHLLVSIFSSYGLEGDEREYYAASVAVKISPELLSVILDIQKTFSDLKTKHSQVKDIRIRAKEVIFLARGQAVELLGKGQNEDNLDWYGDAAFSKEQKVIPISAGQFEKAGALYQQNRVRVYEAYLHICANHVWWSFWYKDCDEHGMTFGVDNKDLIVCPTEVGDVS
jgi:hypothetical protein